MIHNIDSSSLLVVGPTTPTYDLCLKGPFKNVDTVANVLLDREILALMTVPRTFPEMTWILYLVPATEIVTYATVHISLFLVSSTLLCLFSTTNFAARACLCVCVCVRACVCVHNLTNFCPHALDSKRPENFVRIATFPSATFGPLFAFHCPLFFLRKTII